MRRLAAAEEGAANHRWAILVIVVMTTFIITTDITIMNVTIPAVMEDLDSDLATVQWVLSGYSLTVASLLVIGGRLGDLYGERRILAIGAALFAVGALIGSTADSVPALVLGKGVIQGSGAALMLPTTLSILSNTFRGKERAMAFATWGAVAGAGLAFGPPIGGVLTTFYSWRWAFVMSASVALVAVAGALVVVPRGPERARVRMDVAGAILIASPMFLTVLAITRAGKNPTLALALVLVAAVLLAGFVVVERAKERSGGSPLFELGELRHKGFRYGLVTTLFLTLGQMGVLLVIPVFLQDGRHTTAAEAGLWLLPVGLFIIVGSPLGSYLARHVNITTVVRLGLTLEAAGLLAVALILHPEITLVQALPAFALFGVGAALASSQLTNVVLTDVSPDKTGAASGAGSTVRQLGGALGVATMGTLISTRSLSQAFDAMDSAPVPAAIRDQVVEQLRSQGIRITVPEGAGDTVAETVDQILASAVVSGAKPALLFAAAVVACGALISLLIPRVRPGASTTSVDEAEMEGLEALAPLGVEPPLERRS